MIDRNKFISNRWIFCLAAAVLAVVFLMEVLA
jgi:hypothetical protein